MPRQSARQRPDRPAASSAPTTSTSSTCGSTWTSTAATSIKSKDIVLWLDVGLTHITRAEDWPLMSVEWFGSFELKPFMFFDRNAGLDISDAE
jgi:primary-amine oxidase